jgi:hypothetical protein
MQDLPAAAVKVEHIRLILTIARSRVSVHVLNGAEHLLAAVVIQRALSNVGGQAMRAAPATIIFLSLVCAPAQASLPQRIGCVATDTFWVWYGNGLQAAPEALRPVAGQAIVGSRLLEPQEQFRIEDGSLFFWTDSRKSTCTVRSKRSEPAAAALVTGRSCSVSISRRRQAFVWTNSIPVPTLIVA